MTSPGGRSYTSATTRRPRKTSSLTSDTDPRVARALGLPADGTDRERRPVGRPRQDEGKASGANNTIRELGGVFGVAVLAAIFSANGSYASPQTYVEGVVPAVAAGAVVVALSAVVALALPRLVTELRSAEPATPPSLGGGHVAEQVA